MAIKYYMFGGQRVAMKIGSTLTYLHGDHLGSTALATTSAGAWQSQEKYFAYGKDRDSANSVPTDHKFTGQKLDGSGLMYYGARFYDPQTGLFVSPDTIVPDAGLASDYNRFMYARGNSLKYNDPSGHCAALRHENGTYSRDSDISGCWGLVDHILDLWGKDKTGYWNKRFVSQENFINNVVKYDTADAKFMNDEINIFNNSDWVKQQNQAIAKVETMERKSRADDPKHEGTCQDPTTQKCVVGMLDGFSTATAGAAGVCTLLVQPECAGPLAFMSTGASGVTTLITGYNVIQQPEEWPDLAVSVATLVTGAVPTPSKVFSAVKGLGSSVFQWWYDSQN